VVSSEVANGLAYLRVQDGDSTFALHRLQHFTSPAKKPSASLVVDICATGLPDATTYVHDERFFESVAFAAAAAPALDVSLTPRLTKAYHFLEQKDPEQVRRETHELFHSNLELIEELALIKMLEQQATEKAKEAEVFTCKICPREYGGKRNYGFCSSKCREAAKKVPRSVERKCQHGRRKRQCMDCGTGDGRMLPRAPEVPVQGLRLGLLPARAREAQVQGMLNAATAKTRSTLVRRTFDVALISTGLDERQQWRLVAERGQVSGLHDLSNL
jgi:hypothetical protein